MSPKIRIFTAILTCMLSWHAHAIGSTALTAEQMFQILASEIGLQRGEAALAYQTYMSLARNSKDGRLAQRAMEIAIGGNSPEYALEAARQWDQANPKEAREVYVTLLMLNQRWVEVVEPATELLKKSTDKVKLINQWRPLLAKTTDEDAAYKAFFDIVSPSIQQINDPETLYTFSLAAERSGAYEAMEKSLKRILAKKPDDKGALNALGYSYADRGIKLNEALTLLKKAHQLDAQDPYILDSLAWVNYKLGNLETAIEQLRRAFESKPEAEIGAHLGEVLWSNNQQEMALETWKKAEAIDANNKTLKDILQKFSALRSPVKTSGNQIWDGRFSIKISGQVNSEGGSGGFTLSHENQTDVLDVRNPLGTPLAKITITASNAKLEDGKRVLEARDADSLLKNYAGLPLPARGLAKWLRGEPRIGAPASVQRDSLMRTAKLVQDDWNITYQWNDRHQLTEMNLNRRFENGPVEIKLLFETGNE